MAQAVSLDGFATEADSLSPGYGITVDKALTAFTGAGIGKKAFSQTPQLDAAKALYGQIAGLNVYQGQGTSFDNYASLSFHGHAPLVLVDGFPRDLRYVNPWDVESVYVLKDAASAALYGVRGANGIVMVNTRPGQTGKLRIGVRYQFGLNTQYRAPEFADAYTYARCLNDALAGDGLALRYNRYETEAFRSGKYPQYYPDVDWWDEVYNDYAYNHRLNLTFEGGTKRFRYFTSVDYMHDRGFFRTGDGIRYKSDPTDSRLSVRANLGVDVTPTTQMRLDLNGRIAENNRANYGNIYNAVYRTPSAAFPVKWSDGTYGGTAIYGAENPVAMVKSTGNYRYTVGSLMSDLRLTQKLDMLTEGLALEASVAFDNVGTMYDQATDTYQYRDEQAAITTDGTLTSRPVTYGKVSEIVNHSQDFNSLYMRTDVQARAGYDRLFGRHHVCGNIIYEYQNYTASGRNNSNMRQSFIASAGYTFDNRYTVDAVANWSGSSFLEDGDKYRLYPAVSGAWIISNEAFFNTAKINLLKLTASHGISGWDGNLSNELWRQGYSTANSHNYYFSDNIVSYYSLAEDDLPATGLNPETAYRTTVGIDFGAFGNRLSASVEGFWELRKHLLVSSATSVSQIIGIGVSAQSSGEQKYRGLDFSVAWNDRCGDFSYGIRANGSYLDSKVVNDGRGFQPYSYLYHTGDRVGQSYGLEVAGIFGSQLEINESVPQSFSTVKPGDFRYVDQNGDLRIDDQDIVKMHGSSIPRFYFGFGLNFGWKGLQIDADFQGITGRTVNLLDCPLYKPLINNGNISQTFLDNEIPWSTETAATATMPRLTTVSNANNYRNNSVWFRDGSFIKLRNLSVSYTFDKSMLRFAQMKIYLQGTNLFCADNIKTIDPEQPGATYPALRSYWAGIVFNF